jgi:hypothetical protein
MSGFWWWVVYETSFEYWGVPWQIWQAITHLLIGPVGEGLSRDGPRDRGVKPFDKLMTGLLLQMTQRFDPST